MLVVNTDIAEWFSKFILKAQKVRSHKAIANAELQTLNFADSKTAIDFARHHMTHMDKVVFRDDNLPIELFFDFERFIKGDVKRVRELRTVNELRDEDEKIGIKGKTHYIM
jgi:hypothetical protein